MFVAGIDGGGTHTRLELRSGENRLLRRAEFGSFNLNAIGEEAFSRRLEEVFAACGELGDCAGLCVGGAGVSNPRVAQLLEEALEKRGFHGTWKLCGDQEIALRGAMDAPGVAVIAGTGSICFGKNARGETARCGGFGHLIDDEGSGYALGRDALAATVRCLDGRLDAPAFRQAVCGRLGVTTAEEIVAFTYAPETDKAKIAALTPVVLALAQAEERTALAILTRGAAELGKLVSAVQTRLGLAGCDIALLGGLLTGENPYRTLVAQTLSRLGRVVSPAHDALWGAAQMAWELQ